MVSVNAEAVGKNGTGTTAELMSAIRNAQTTGRSARTLVAAMGWNVSMNPENNAGK